MKMLGEEKQPKVYAGSRASLIIVAASHLQHVIHLLLS